MPIAQPAPTRTQEVDSALDAIRAYAREHKLEGKDVRDLFTAGILARGRKAYPGQRVARVRFSAHVAKDLMGLPAMSEIRDATYDPQAQTLMLDVDHPDFPEVRDAHSMLPHAAVIARVISTHYKIDAPAPVEPGA